jgi:hypothetical protein
MTMIRVTRPWVTSLFVLAATFALAARAHAGAFGSQISSDVCPDAFATDNMSDPNTAPFANAATFDQCVRLCRQTGADCKAFSRRAAACDVSWAESTLRFNIADCVRITSTATDLRACDGSAKSTFQEQLAGFKSNLGVALSDCDNWDMVCENHCGL